MASSDNLYENAESRPLWQRYALSVAFTLGLTGLLILAVALIYNVAPNCSQPFQLLTPGAVVAVVGWLSASLLCSAYTATVGHYNATYGSIAAIIEA